MTIVSKLFRQVGIRYIVIMPDSMSSKLYACLSEEGNSNIIHCLNETDVVTITSGLNITGVLSVAIMENSGIRSACDLISRFELSHHIHNIYIISSRGGIGEENWWGIRHKTVTMEILNKLNILCTEVHSIDELQTALHKAVKSFKTEQTSVVLNLTSDFFDNLPQ